jgi:hypothetical protein
VSRPRRLSAGQRAVEAVAGTIVTAPIVAAFVVVPLVAELLEQVPDPRLALWAIRDMRARTLT